MGPASPVHVRRCHTNGPGFCSIFNPPALSEFGLFPEPQTTSAVVGLAFCSFMLGLLVSQLSAAVASDMRVGEAHPFSSDIGDALELAGIDESGSFLGQGEQLISNFGESVWWNDVKRLTLVPVADAERFIIVTNHLRLVNGGAKIALGTPTLPE